MSSKIQQIRGGQDDVYPVTKTAAVYDDAGNRLDNVLNDLTEGLSRVPKHKKIVGTTNESGIIFSGNSNLDGSEIILAAYCNWGDSIAIPGNGVENRGHWIQCRHYNDTLISNSGVEIDIWYI